MLSISKSQRRTHRTQINLVILLLALPGWPQAFEPKENPSLPLAYRGPEAVTYKEYHDPWRVFLEDGRELSVRFVPEPTGNLMTYEEVDAWERGRSLVFAHSSRSGVVLLDPANGKELPVVGGYGDRHPFDMLLDKELEKEGSTMGMQAAYDENRALWQYELDRLVRRVREIRGEAELESGIRKAASSLLHAQKKWEKFRKAHSAASRDLDSQTAGTLSIILAAEAGHDFVRHRALELGSQVASLEEILAHTLDAEGF